MRECIPLVVTFFDNFCRLQVLIDILFGTSAVDIANVRRDEQHRRNSIGEMYESVTISSQNIAYAAVVVSLNIALESGLMVARPNTVYPLRNHGIQRMIPLTTALSTRPLSKCCRTMKIHGSMTCLFCGTSKSCAGFS